MQRIEGIINDSAEQIKKIILNKIKELNPFPTFIFGEREKTLETNGILIYDSNSFITERVYVILMPGGLYQFSAAMFMRKKDGKNIDHEMFPDLNTKTEPLLNYLIYGERIDKILLNIYKLT